MTKSSLRFEKPFPDDRPWYVRLPCINSLLCLSSLSLLVPHSSFLVHRSFLLCFTTSYLNSPPSISIAIGKFYTLYHKGQTEVSLLYNCHTFAGNQPQARCRSNFYTVDIAVSIHRRRPQRLHASARNDQHHIPKDTLLWTDTTRRDANTMGWVFHFDTALLVVILTRCVQRCVTGISLVLPQGLQRDGFFVLFFFLSCSSSWVFGRNDGRYTGGCFCLCAGEMQRALVKGTRCNVKGTKLAVINNQIVHTMDSFLFIGRLLLMALSL